MLNDYPFLDLSSEMGRKVAAFDWSGTSLGPIDGWSAGLKTTVGLVLRSGFAKCICWGPDHVAIFNDAFVPILGDKKDCLGKPFSEIWSEAWGSIGPIAEKAMNGQATFIKDYPLAVQRSGGGLEEANFTFSYSPLVDEKGVVQGFIDTVVETTEKVRFERGAVIRNGELVHRMKNSYALVAAMVNQTARTSSTKEELQRKLIDRLAAMGRAQDVLSLREHGRATLRDVVQHAVGRFQEAEGRIAASGPEVALDDDETFALTLALYELGTNATKYGALSADEGSVLVRWSFDPQAEGDTFRFEWREQGGPAVTPPSRSGFGTFLIGKALAGEFNGEVDLDYAPAGLTCTLRSANFRRGPVRAG